MNAKPAPGPPVGLRALIEMTCRVRLAWSRTPASHAGNMGSNPIRGTSTSFTRHWPCPPSSPRASASFLCVYPICRLGVESTSKAPSRSFRTRSGTSQRLTLPGEILDQVQDALPGLRSFPQAAPNGVEDRWGFACSRHCQSAFGVEEWTESVPLKVSKRRRGPPSPSVARMRSSSNRSI